MDGIDLSTVRLNSYRTQLGVVLQETFLFDGTIRENVAFSRPNSTEAEIMEAMRSLLTRAKLYVEGSGAAATAALLAGKVRVPAGTVVVSIVSGGTVDPERVLGLFSAPAAGVAA